MTSEQFAYWLQGFVELNGSEPTAEQWQSIKERLSSVAVSYPATSNWPLLDITLSDLIIETNLADPIDRGPRRYS